MKSQLNFKVVKEGIEYDMHEMGIWVSSFRIYSPNASRTKIVVPGMPGAHLASTEEGERQVYVAMQLEEESYSKFEELKLHIFDLFYSNGEITIIRDIWPDKEIKILQEGSYDINNITTEDGEFELLLTMLDPYIYGPEVTYEFQSDVGEIDNKGTAEAKPIIELVVKQPVTFAMIQNHLEEYMMIGQPIDIENQRPYVKYERIFYDDAKTLNGWSTAANGEIDGIIAGNMEPVNDRFQAVSYGAGTGWHGPALKKSLSETLRDFRLSTYIALDNSGVAVGRIELYLLDASGNQVAKVAMKDTQSGRALGFGEARAGNALNNHYLINEYGDSEGNWNNFAGILRIEREGNYWRAYFAKGNSTAGYHTRRFAYWKDNESKYTAPIAQVVVHMGQHGTMAPITGGIYSISVDKINTEPSGGIPYIADVGDIIQFNHVENMIYINGEPMMVEKNFGASFFNLQKGINQLIVHPSEAFITSLKYRERFR